MPLILILYVFYLIHEVIRSDNILKFRRMNIFNLKIVADNLMK